MVSPLLKLPYLRMKYRFFPNKAQKFWAQELLNSQGISAKIGQVLGQGHETELPKTSLSPKAAQDLFEKNFAVKIEVQGEALAASMGQVFSFRYAGKTHALKILHPGLRMKLGKEIENLLLLGHYFAKAKGFKFDTGVFKSFLVEVFEEETDLKREAQFQQKFAAIFQGDPRFTVPNVIVAFSNESLLCQDWVASNLARDLRQFPSFDIFHFFFKALLNEGILHGDLNDRNWGVTTEKTFVVYDYGCSQIVSERRTSGFKKLVLNRDVVTAFSEFGVRLESTWFKGREQELRDALFGPLLQSQIAPEWSYSKDLEAKFGDKIKILREFTDPWVLLMMRSLFSLIRIYQARRIAIPLRDLLAPYLALRDAASELQVHVEITERGRQVFYLTLPFQALKNLRQHISEKTTHRIQEEGGDIDLMIAKSLEQGAQPQELFAVLVEGRSHRVWIS